MALYLLADFFDELIYLADKLNFCKYACRKHINML